MTRIPHKKSFIIIVLVGTLTQICTDMYTPSLPAIAHTFHTTLGQAQLTMSYFIAGVAMTTLLYGPISEGIGRRWTLLLGTSIALCGTLMCWFSPHIDTLQLGRFIQGCGLGACASLWRTIFKDTYTPKEMNQVMGYLVALVTLSVIISPFIGGYIEHYFGWRTTFTILSGWMLCIILLILCLFQETSQHHGLHRLKVSFVLQSYRELLTNPGFVGASMISFLAYGGLFSWLTAGPIILIHGANLSPITFGQIMILLGIASGASAMISGTLTKTRAITTVLQYGLVMMSVAGILLWLLTTWLGLNPYVIVSTAILFVSGATFIFMNCFAWAFENVGHIAGYAGAMYSFLQLLGGGLFSTVLGHLNTNSPTPLACMLFASGLGGAMAYYVALKYHK